MDRTERFYRIDQLLNERRVVPLDLIPAGMLDSVVIQKSWLPNMPGEFGGGVVELRTRDFPLYKFAHLVA